MAFDLDFLTQIINVHWATEGGIFIAGSINVSNNTLAGKVEDLDQNLVMAKLDLAEFFGGNGVVNAASYTNVGGTKPTFLIAGNDDGSTASQSHQNEVGVIVASKDGKTWTQVLKLEETRGDWQNFAVVMELVWHKASKAFYAGVYTQQQYIYDHTITGDPIIRGVSYNSIYKSTTGYSWSKIGEQILTDLHDVESPLKPYYNPHTNLPDGVSSYWEQLDNKGTVIESVAVIPSNPPIPDYGFGFVGLDLDYPDPALIIAKHFDGETTQNIVLIQGNIGCYAGGVYVIASGGKIFSSNDNGDSWYLAGSIDPYAFNAMCGGAIQDQET